MMNQPVEKVLTFDIGVLSSTSSAQMPSSKTDPIICISVLLQHFDASLTHHIYFFGNVGNVPGVEMLRFKTEQQLLEAFLQLVEDFAPDVLVGYNTTVTTLTCDISRNAVLFTICLKPNETS